VFDTEYSRVHVENLWTRYKLPVQK